MTLESLNVSVKGDLHCSRGFLHARGSLCVYRHVHCSVETFLSLCNCSHTLTYCGEFTSVSISQIARKLCF